MKRVAAFCLALLVLLAAAPPAALAEGEETQVIASAEDFLTFAAGCAEESYSLGRVFELTQDLDLTGSIFVAHCLSCSMACGTFPHQGSNPCLQHWQVDSLPLNHQGSPNIFLFILTKPIHLCLLTMRHQPSVYLTQSSEKTGKTR